MTSTVNCQEGWAVDHYDKFLLLHAGIWTVPVPVDLHVPIVPHGPDDGPSYEADGQKRNIVKKTNWYSTSDEYLPGVCDLCWVTRSSILRWRSRYLIKPCFLFWCMKNHVTKHWSCNWCNEGWSSNSLEHRKRKTKNMHN